MGRAVEASLLSGLLEAHRHDHAAHLDQPLTVEAIAAEAGISPRALQLAFRQHRGTTPVGLWRDMRLAQAHAGGGGHGDRGGAALAGLGISGGLPKYIARALDCRRAILCGRRGARGIRTDLSGKRLQNCHVCVVCLSWTQGMAESEFP